MIPTSAAYHSAAGQSIAAGLLLVRLLGSAQGPAGLVGLSGPAAHM